MTKKLIVKFKIPDLVFNLDVPPALDIDNSKVDPLHLPKRKRRKKKDD